MEPASSPYTSGETHIDVDFSDRPSTNSGKPNYPGAPTVPLLLHPKSKVSFLDDLRNFQISLRWCALDHSSCSGKFTSYFVFTVLSIVVPILNILAVRVPQDRASGVAFNKLAQIPESALAAISFFTISRFFRCYGLGQLLFLDGLREDTPYVRCGYVKQLDRAFRYLMCILLPSFAVELAHKILFFSTVSVSVPHVHARVPGNSVMFVAVLASWVYRTGLFLLVCVLFRVTCELQILRIEGFRKMLEGCGSDASVIFREHVRIKQQLLVTSHRYRIYIIGCLITITVTQLGGLMLVLASKSEKNFFNSGDLVVCSAVQLSGFFMCLIGAARITHRAQGVVAIATKWHMLMTCASEVESNLLATKDQMLAPGVDGSPRSDSTKVSEPLDSSVMFSVREASSFQTRQALVMYLQHNNGGITLFGFTLDRRLLHSIFAFELTLVLWILSKV